MPQKSFEELLREKSGSFAPLPKDSTWDKIAAGLDDEKKVSVFFPYRYAFAAALILIVGITALFLDVEQKQEIHPGHDGKLSEKEALHNSISPDRNEVETFGANEKRGKADSHIAEVPIFNPSSLEKDRKKNYDQSSLLTKEDILMIPRAFDPVQELQEESFLLKIIGMKKLPVDFALEDIHNLPQHASFYKIKYPVKPGKEKYRFFASVQMDMVDNISRVTLDKDYKGVMPYQSEYEYRKAQDKGGRTNAYSFALGLQARRHSFSLGVRSFGVKYKMCVNNVEYDFNLGSYVRNNGSFSYTASDSFVAEISGNGGGYVTNSLTYIGIPLTYSYRAIAIKPFSLSLNGGLQCNFLYKNNSQIKRENTGIYVKPDVSTENTMSASHWSFNAGVSLNLHLNEHFELSLSPEFRQSIQAIEKGIVSTGYRQMSFSAGLRYYPF